MPSFQPLAGDARRPAFALWRTEIAATLSLGWPLVLANLAQIGMATTDVVLLGRLGRDALAAGALAANLYHAVLIFGIGVVTAVSPLLAEEFGRRKHAVREVRRTVRQGLWTAGLISLPLWAALWQGEAILLLIGQEPELAKLAGSYLRTLQWSLLPALSFIVLRHFLAAKERPGWALAMALAALPLNGLLAWAMIFGHLGLPALGIVGAGIATSIVNFVMFFGLALIVSTHRRFRRYHLFGRVWRPDWPRLARIWQVGMPIGIILAFEITIFNAAAFLQGLIGADSLAAHAIAIQISAASFMVPLGISQAATVRVGLAYGARDHAGISRAGWTAFILVIGFMSAMSLVLVTVPAPLIALFVDPDHGETIQVARLALGFVMMAALFQVFDGAQAVLAGMLRGLQDTRAPMWIAGFGYWIIGGGACFLLGFHTPLAGLGIWLGLAIGLAIVSVLLLARWTARGRLGLTLRPSDA